MIFEAKTMNIREKIISEINVLSEIEIKQVSQFLEFIKFQTKKQRQIKKHKQADSIFNLGKKPVHVDVPDASENLDQYLY